MTNELTLENIRSGAFPSDAHAVGFLLGEIEQLQMRLKRHEPVSLYNGHDIDWWKAESERLRDALKRVRRVAAEGTTHTGMIAALGNLVDRALNPGNGPLPPDYTYHSHEPGAVTRLPVPRTQMTRLSDIADELIRQLRKQGMEKMQAVFDGMRLRIDPWPDSEGASRDASSGITWTCESCGMRGRPPDVDTCINCGSKRTFE